MTVHPHWNSDWSCQRIYHYIWCDASFSCWSSKSTSVLIGDMGFILYLVEQQDWMNKAKCLHKCSQSVTTGDSLISTYISIHRCSVVNIITIKISMTESNFTIVHFMLFFTAYHYWSCVYHWKTCILFSLRNELQWLHLDKQYWCIAPLRGSKLENKQKFCFKKWPGRRTRNTLTLFHLTCTNK